MSDSFSHRSNRTLAIADHLWEALETMARDMGADRDALVNQALFTFARLNGYVIPGRPSAPVTLAPPARLFEAPRPTELAESLPVADAAALPFPVEIESRRAAARAPQPAPHSPSKAAKLYLETRQGDPVPVTLERFLIGRGKHCDLVIDSNRVSREHAVIFREEDVLLIEDLTSSNGTWIHKQRITRRKIEAGDEYLLGNEKLTCLFRED